MITPANSTNPQFKKRRAAGTILLIFTLCAILLLGCSSPEPESDIVAAPFDRPTTDGPDAAAPEIEIVVIPDQELEAFLADFSTPLALPVENPSVSRNWNIESESLHYGIDYLPENAGASSILAAADGTVSLAEFGTAGYGNYIIIDHDNGLQTLYAHCDTLHVSVGDVVEAGQEIALMGSSGDATGVHLHFEVRVDGKNADPVRFF